MQSNSLHAIALRSLSLAPIFAALCNPTIAQADSVSAPTGDGNSAVAAAVTDDAVPGLPGFLLKVPGGTVQVGMPVDAFVTACSEAVFPFSPKVAHEKAEKQFITALRHAAGCLDARDVTVTTFLLGKTHVTNAQYLAFVEAERAAKRPIKAPFHWWRFGRQDDFEERAADIRKEFPGEKLGALYYWERHGEELPFKVADEKGGSLLDHPVTYVSWRDANRYAASLGMRLPSEFELTRALRGDGKNAWPLGTAEQDSYHPDLLKKLGMGTSSDYHTKSVGTVAAAKGPFGHLDMYGQVWHLVGDLGFGPLHGMESYLEAWEDLQKHKTGRLVDSKPLWAPELTIARGGSFLSYQEPIQLLIDARAPIGTSDALESVGFRLAKSLQPGYDYVFSLMRVDFNRGVLARDQEIVLPELSGAERYTNDANGFPVSYDAIAFAPVNFLRDEKSVRVKMLLEETQAKPILLGALATSQPLSNGTAPGMYALLYRDAGVPDELRDAIKRGHKAIVKARKDAERNKGKKEDDKDKDKDKDKAEEVTKWRMVTNKYGLTDDDLAETKAQTGDCGFIRINGVTVPTDQQTFLLSKNDEVISVLAGTKTSPSKGSADDDALEILAGEKDHAGKALARFTLSVPLLRRDAKKTLLFKLDVPIETEAPSTTRPWRLPASK